MSGPLKKYKVVRNGFETVMKLSAEDAEKLGAGPYQVRGGASTIEPVTAVADGGSEDGSGAPAPASPAVAMSDAGTAVSVTPASVPPQEPGDGDQAPEVPQTPPAPQGTATPDDGQTPVAPAAAPKAPPKKRSPSANKARGGAANKAADGGS
ncbi:hypothetical protein [Streptomyces hirsutus]|uniref:hypothetical protein n=1 Tax=Streptomyces hirsutus TaxID=35620 RepID=UPI00369B6443